MNNVVQYAQDILSMSFRSQYVDAELAVLGRCADAWFILTTHSQIYKQVKILSSFRVISHISTKDLHLPEVCGHGHFGIHICGLCIQILLSDVLL